MGGVMRENRKVVQTGEDSVVAHGFWHLIVLFLSDCNPSEAGGHNLSHESDAPQKIYSGDTEWCIDLPPTPRPIRIAHYFQPPCAPLPPVKSSAERLRAYGPHFGEK